VRIVQVVPSVLPAPRYGGTERVVWWLTRALADQGHAVVLLADAGTRCDFAEVKVRDPAGAIEGQIPGDADVVHFHYPYAGSIDKPFIVTIHANGTPADKLHHNAVFISRDHARRHGSDVFVYNGIDPAEYGVPILDNTRDYFHFLGKAAWRVKNVRGAIRIARKADVRLAVLGGYRFNLNMGFRFTLDRNVSFHGMVGGAQKNRLLNGSRGLIFPVQWHEPFGLAVVESLYFGCPVVATPFGALPELVPPEVGVLSDRFDELVDAVRHVEGLSRVRCHEWVQEHFTARIMAARYVKLYERVVAGESLNRVTPGPPVAPEVRIVQGSGHGGRLSG
jgi:glycosyltransferase involved in cell wall biosynthesis